MDYNDNDYEGQNLHLAGEESSKISVLRPFALPKFDFDDSLHGHLRFDSLVENEVFLGIPSQEDNHWIEDFSRGGNGIEFSSSAAESCALPRHINVWSEATSSESVEMLLKAVGQEEMNPGENMIQESDPGNQLGSSTRKTDNNLGKDYKVDDVDNGNPSLSPAEVEGNLSKSNQSAGVEGVQTENTLQVQETKLSSSGVCVDSKDSSLTVYTESLDIGMKKGNDNQGETCGLVDESLSNQVKETSPVPGKEIDNTDSSSQNIDVSVRESVEKDKISDTSFVSSSCIAKGISDPVKEQEEGCKENDVRLSGIAVETVNKEMHCSQEIPLRMQSSKDDHAVETCITDSGKASSMPGMMESVSTDDGCNKVSFVLEPAGGSQHSAVSSAEIKQLSEGHSILHEKSSVALQGEGIEGLRIRGSDVVTPTTSGNNEAKQVPSVQSVDQQKSLVDISPGGNSSVEYPSAKSESSMSHDIPGNPSDKVDDHNINHAADGTGNSRVAGKCCGEKSMTDHMKDARYTAAIEKENVEDKDHVPLPIVAGSIRTCAEDIASMRVDAQESNLDVSALEKEGKKLPLDSRGTVRDDIGKELGSACSGKGVEVEKTTQSQPESSVGDYPGHRDQNKEAESEAPKEASPAVLKGSMESNELAPAIEIDKGMMPDSAAGETETSDQSVPLLETSGLTMPDKASKELSKKMEHSTNVLITEDDVVEAAHANEPMEAETERKCGANSSAFSVTSSSVEVDNSNKDAVRAPSCSDPSESGKNKQASLQKDNIENIGKVLPSPEISGVNEPSKEEGTFTFDVRPLGGQSIEDSGKDLQSFPRLQACKMSLTGEGSPSVSGSSHMDPMIVKETSHVSSSAPRMGPPPGGLGGPSERKSRRGGSKSGKGSKKGNLVKETSPLKQTEKGDKSSPFLSPLGAGQLMTFESGLKPRGAVSIPTSSLPDLNTSAPSSAFFQQPFTDLQQVQLRAQIFVYGSLIQGAAPDEACMVSAFDGGRSFWERSWRACVERLHGQKSQGNNSGTPVPSRSGSKAPDQTSRQGFPQNEVLSSTAGRASNKAIPSPVANPMIPLSSPLWSISTPSGEALPPSSMGRSAVIDYQAVSPLNPYQTPPLRNYVAHTTWPSQAPAAPFPVPWLASSQSSPFEISTNYAAFPITEPAKLAAVKESPMPITSGTKHVPPIHATHPGATTMLAGASPLDLKKAKVSTGQTGDAKTRKRKKSSGAEDVVHTSVTATLTDTVSAHAVANQLSNKAPAVEDLGQISLIAQNHVGSMPPPIVGSCYFSTSVAVTTPSSFVPKGTTNQAFTVISPPISSGHLNKGDLSRDKRALNIEGFSKVEEAKLQAQEAAAHATAAISHCESVWRQLDQQKSSGLTSDAESKLASAAVAIAAAASVAKAAAAAAKIASNAAMQAKQMADEAATKSGTINTTDYESNLVYNSTNLANASPVSILKGGDRNNAPSLAISAAREAARKRIEAASAATRHAENLDAIVKAAELAAEAVAHAGKVVAMGDPFSLSALAEAGPNNYWKLPQVASRPGSRPNDMNKNKSISDSGEMPNLYNQHGEPDKDTHDTSDVVPSIQRQLSGNVEDHVTVEENLISSIKHGENSSKPHKDTNISDSAKTALVVSNPDIESRSDLFTTSIKEGSHVEVLKDRAGKKAWFSANVLSLKDGEALVCYTGLQSDEGSEQLKEWISLEAKDGETPKVRIPHSMTAMLFEGTRKRRRAAVKDYTWSAGDRVDAWVQDCWCEGIIAEKNKKDATTLSVHFPAQGEILMVKVWHLRPSLIWSGDQWIEWCRPGQDGTSQGDTPVEKRPKLGSTSIEAKGKIKMPKDIEFAERGRNEEPRLPLSANEKVFSIGSTREDNKQNMVRTMRSGLEKEGSRVVFGVPKPGKKRKFMEVSKHYVSDKTAKTNVPNDSVKLAKFLPPQGSGSRGFKNTSRPDFKEKQVAEPKPRALKSAKPPSIPNRTLTRKDDSTSSRSNARDAALSDHIEKGSVSNDENELSEQNPADVEDASGGAMVFSSQALPQDNRKKAARNTKSERLNQGKLAPAGGKSAKDEATEKLVSEVAEPRRSNRRIQPTSRLLEGLQSSLIISKIPSSSHDKGHRSHRGTARGNNNRG